MSACVVCNDTLIDLHVMALGGGTPPCPICRPKDLEQWNIAPDGSGISHKVYDDEADAAAQNQVERDAGDSGA